MTFKYKNVYINDTSTISGPYEKKGPLNNFFDGKYFQIRIFINQLNTNYIP